MYCTALVGLGVLVSDLLQNVAEEVIAGSRALPLKITELKPKQI